MKRRHAALLAFLLGPGAALAEVPSERVGFASLDPGVALDGWLYRPPGEGPFPALVLLHGCGGPGRGGQPSARHRQWAGRLRGEGYLALLVDSFAGRGVREICTQKSGQRALRPAHRVQDAYGALRYLQARPDVLAGRVGVLGWSHGGTTTLHAVDAPAQERFAAPGGDGFRAAVAFYPGCTQLNRQAEMYRLQAPLQVLIGEADDWTPAEPCAALTKTVAARGEPMRIALYPGAYHGFDSPNAPLRVRHDVPNGVRPGSGVTHGTDPAAREDALARVSAFFAENLK